MLGSYLCGPLMFCLFNVQSELLSAQISWRRLLKSLKHPHNTVHNARRGSGLPAWIYSGGSACRCVWFGSCSGRWWCRTRWPPARRGRLTAPKWRRSPPLSTAGCPPPGLCSRTPRLCTWDAETLSYGDRIGPRWHIFLCVATPQSQQTAPLAKRIKMLRINEQRWSIVYFKYPIFIFLWCLQTDWPIVGRRGACLLAPCVSHSTNTCWLVCFINGKTLVEMF